MILTVCSYEVLGRRGLLMFHQKTQSAASKSIAQRIFDYFELSYSDILKDRDSTRIRSADDMDEPEIQILENAKLRAMKSLPQSSLYWGNDLYHVHMNAHNVFLKLPLWYKLYRTRGSVCEILELDQSWTKIERSQNDSYIVSPRTPHAELGRLISHRELRKRQSFRVANFLSQPYLNAAPQFCIDSEFARET